MDSQQTYKYHNLKEKEMELCGREFCGFLVNIPLKKKLN